MSNPWWMTESKNKEERMRELGFTRAGHMTLSARIGEWIKKIWSHIEEDNAWIISDVRLCQELGVKSITNGTRAKMKARGVLIKKIVDFWGNKNNKVISWQISKEKR